MRACIQSLFCSITRADTDTGISGNVIITRALPCHRADLFYPVTTGKLRFVKSNSADQAISFRTKIPRKSFPAWSLPAAYNIHESHSRPNFFSVPVYTPANTP